MLQVYVIKTLMIFKWPWVAGMDENFMAKFFFRGNLGFLLGCHLSRYYLGSFHISDHFQLLSGKYFQLQEKGPPTLEITLSICQSVCQTMIQSGACLSGLPRPIFGRQDCHSCGQITSMQLLPPPCSIPQIPGKTVFLAFLPLVASLLIQIELMCPRQSWAYLIQAWTIEIKLFLHCRSISVLFFSYSK